MTYEESIPVAKELAERTLQKGFDVEAFLVLSEINRLTYIDKVPGTEIDEGIDKLAKIFVSYYNEKTVNSEKTLLNALHQIISELYHTCENTEQKTVFIEFLNGIHNIK